MSCEVLLYFLVIPRQCLSKTAHTSPGRKRSDRRQFPGKKSVDEDDPMSRKIIECKRRNVALAHLVHAVAEERFEIEFCQRRDVGVLPFFVACCRESQLREPRDCGLPDCMNVRR